jgi:endogenous inhibitor of DNA gyrase (YacG/DUF329 family)
MMSEARCPVCKKPVVAQYRPFCSRRCSQIDLGKWLGESYRFEAPPDDDEEVFIRDDKEEDE